MQEIALDIWWTVALGTIALLAIAVGFVVVVVVSKQKELITKQRQFEELAASERKYRNLFDHSSTGMLRIVIDDWNVVDANNALLRLFRVLKLNEVKEVLHSMSFLDREQLQTQLLREGSVEDYKLLLHGKDGSELWTSFSASLIPNEGFIEAVIIDITQSRQAEDKIREQATLLDQAQDAIFVLDLNKTMRYWNKGAERLYGYTSLEVFGRDVTQYMYDEEETRGFQHAYDATVKHSEWSGELRQKIRNGTAIICDCRWTLVRNANGEPTGILQVCTDVTERKKLESRFLRAQRLESIGIFASGIAHDLSNTLAPVLVGVDVLKRKLRDQQSRRLLNVIESSAKYGSEMVYRVLAFVKGVEGRHVRLNPYKIIKDIINVLDHIVPDNIMIHTRVADSISPIMGDATQLHQVLINLCTNACDAMQQGGELTFSAENVLVTEEMAKDLADAAEGTYVVFCINDTGVGISPEEINKIFEPFYTTKELGKGTGLGLSICLGIVKGHRGFLTVESVEGNGSTFKIFIPVATTKANIQQGIPPQEFHRYIIFVTDAEEDYSRALLEGLEENGYEPLIVEEKSQVVVTLLEHLGKSQTIVLDGFSRDETPAMIKFVTDFDPRIRFIVLAEKSQVKKIVELEPLQSHTVLAHPVKVESLLEAIEQLTLNEKK